MYTVNKGIDTINTKYSRWEENGGNVCVSGVGWGWGDLVSECFHVFEMSSRCKMILFPFTNIFTVVGRE